MTNKKASFIADEEKNLMVNPDNYLNLKDVEVNSTTEEQPPMKLGSNITPYLLLLALSLHGFFEGVALGVQSTVGSCLKLVFAILAHKWAEAFTLVIRK